MEVAREERVSKRLEGEQPESGDRIGLVKLKNDRLQDKGQLVATKSRRNGTYVFALGWFVFRVRFSWLKSYSTGLSQGEYCGRYSSDT